MRVDLPGGAVVTGQARDIDPDGRLVLDPAGTDGGCDPRVVASGDVLHVR